MPKSVVGTYNRPPASDMSIDSPSIGNSRKSNPEDKWFGVVEFGVSLRCGQINYVFWTISYFPKRKVGGQKYAKWSNREGNQ
jgi:hypothetical protein